MLIVTKKHVRFIFKSLVLFVFKAVAVNPLAANRCFHWTVQLVIRVCEELRVYSRWPTLEMGGGLTRPLGGDRVSCMPLCGLLEA